VDLLVTMFQQYQSRLVELPIAPNTRKAYASRVRHYLAFVSFNRATCDEGFPDWTFSVNEYRQYLRHYQNQDAGSINNTLTAVQHFLSCCGQDRLPIAREPVQVKASAVLSDYQYRTFLSVAFACNDKRNRALALLISLSDLRVGQCSQLRLEHLNGTEPGNLLITRGEHAALSLHPIVANALIEWLQIREPTCLGQQQKENTDFVFFSRSMSPLSKRGIDYIIRSMGWSANLDVSPEKLRRTYKMCLARNVNFVEQSRI
jgi:site-specific recombinase XerD